MTTSADLAGVTGSGVREFMRNWSTGVAVVTSELGSEPVGCTVNAFTSVSLDPPLLLVSLSDRSRTLAAIRRRGAFGVTVLGRRQRSLAERFATGTGDRFAGVPHRRELGIPVLGGAVASTVCKLERSVVAGDHTLVLGRPLWCGSGGEEEPLIFFGGAIR